MIYRPEIDGLRAVAVLPVILFHAGYSQFSGGFIGVDVFFVISGYLVASMIIEDVRSDRFSVASFFERRARRILPAILFVALVCLPLAWILMLPYQLENFAENIIGIFTFTSNIVLWRQTSYFAEAAILNPLLHTWSLAVEEQYYLFLPVFFLLTRKLQFNRIVVTLALLCLLSFLAAEWGWKHHPTANFFLGPTRYWEMLIGSILALFMFDHIDNRQYSLILKNCLSILGLSLIIFSIVSFTKETPMPSRYTLLPIVGTSLILVFATSETVVGKFLSLRPLVIVGLTSYSLYLWHQPLFSFIRIGWNDELGQMVYLGLSIPLFGMAYLTWKYIEQPFRRRNRVSLRTLFYYVAFMTVPVFAIAAGIKTNNGYDDRWAIKDRYLVNLDPSELGQYVNGKYFDYQLMDFPLGKPNLLLIGDSHAQDLLNVFSEINLLESTSVSTLYIRPECGSIIVDPSIDLSLHIDDQSIIERCTTLGFYWNPIENDILKERLSQADVVVLAASWNEFNSRLLIESLSYLHSLSTARLVIVGKKDFGDVNPRLYIQLSEPKRIQLKNKLRSSSLRVNRYMKEIINPHEFIDLLGVVCGPDLYCPVFTGEGKLISYDGRHLTPEGAKWVGERLISDGQIRQFMQSQ